MFIFGHMGIGARLVTPWRKRLPKAWLLVGTLLPDVIDKILFYMFHTFVGTRSFGHTALLTATMTLASVLGKSPHLLALSVGSATHLFLDNLGDRIQGLGDTSAWRALIFPFGPGFSPFPYQNALEHLHALGRPFIIGSEIIGILFLIRDTRFLRKLIWRRSQVPNNP